MTLQEHITVTTSNERDVVWLTRPKENFRRVFFYGHHNDDPKQMFRSSLPIGRVAQLYAVTRLSRRSLARRLITRHLPPVRLGLH